MPLRANIAIYRPIRLCLQAMLFRIIRDGLLAHPYMLGPNGQSNGCVSFSNYPAFPTAFLRGEVDRLVVVQRLATAPTPWAGPEWLPQPLRNLFFKPS
jgi:hypothetical protein